MKPDDSRLTESPFREPTRVDNLRRSIRRLVHSIAFECSVALLVLLSVGLTLCEIGLDTYPGQSTARQLLWLVIINELITVLFVLELSLRFFVTSSKRAFFKEYWIDILAVLPLFRIFRSWRALRLLRLIRVLRLFGVMTRLSTHYPYIFRRGMVEYMTICGLLVVTVVFATMAMTYLENAAVTRRGALQPVEDEIEINDSDQEAVDSVAGDNETREKLTIESAFWFSLYSLFAGEPVAHEPKTVGGKIVTVFVMFMGLTIFAMFTGTVSAYMVDRFRAEGGSMDIEDLIDHIIICGWNKKAEIIVDEYRATKLTRSLPIVVISETDPSNFELSDWLRSQITFLHDDFTRVAALERAGVYRAKTCIILSDQTGGRTDQDADARTILAALTVERLNPNVYTCAELLNQDYGPHLQMGNVNDYVVSGEYSAYMLAQSAMNRGLMEVIGELLTYQRGNEFYRHELPKKWFGKSFVEVMQELKRNHNAILVAVHPLHGKVVVNPNEHVFEEGDEIVIIATSEVDLELEQSGSRS